MAVIVAIILTALFGFAALVIDVGGMHAEVRQLQNVADAGALAIVQTCADGGDCSDAAAELTAQEYATLNSLDSQPDGSGGANTSVAIPGNSGGNSVTVTATTRDASGGYDGNVNTLEYFFAQVMGVTESTFTRTATAAYGRMGGGATIPIALCERNWDHFTSAGTVLPSGPPAHIVQFGSPNPNSTPPAYQDCSNPSYDTYPGGFGFLERDENCMAISEENAMFPGVSGNNPVDPASECTVPELYTMLKMLIDTPPSIALVPIFDGFAGQGSSGAFHIIGYGAFKLEGYTIQAGPGGSSRTYAMAPNECDANASCLKGYYTEFVTLDAAASFSAGPGFGAYFVGLTG